MTEYPEFEGTRAAESAQRESYEQPENPVHLSAKAKLCSTPQEVEAAEEEALAWARKSNCC